MAPQGILAVATCQFPIGSSVARNGAAIRRQIAEAARRGARIVHFPEAALSGYGGQDLKEGADFDWPAIRAQTKAVCAEAKARRVWVVLGSAHQLSGRHRPHNCLYLIGPDGRIVDRYDKRFCTAGDLRHYTPGDHFATFAVNGVRCGLLVCYDLRFPELYRAYKKLGVQCMFHSFYNARAKGRTIHTIIMRRTLQAHAGINYMWISAANACGYYQLWPGVLIQPDGAIAASLRQHRSGVMVRAVDTRREFYDASAPHRHLAMKGILHSGRTVRDPRSRNRTGI